MMKRKPILERVGDFMEGRGFYIVLTLCVAAIGISGYYLFSSLQTGGEETAVSAPTQVVVAVSPTVEAVKPTVTASPTPSATPTPAPSEAPSAAPSATPAPAQTPAEETTAPAQAADFFIWPLRGQVVADWSLEVLAYDETMGDWRTHSGVDIAASVGTNVLAISAGTVQGVYDDDLMGTCVVVDHGDGLTSTYCNLSAKPTVSEGDTVSTGTVLGVVGETAIAESSRPSHLHLEMAQDGKAVDPVSYLPQR